MPEEETGQTPLFVPVGNARGWTLSWWYPCRISCKPEQWSILKGECVPLKRPVGRFAADWGTLLRPSLKIVCFQCAASCP